PRGAARSDARGEHTSTTDLEREARLREMGLAPRWRLRAGRTPAEEDQTAASGVLPAEPPPTETRIACLSRDAAIATLEWKDLVGHIAQCDACALARTRKKTVPGVGSATAGWMFVGEAPGAEEDAQGEPFVGQAGRLLDNMLRAIGLERARDV